MRLLKKHALNKHVRLLTDFTVGTVIPILAYKEGGDSELYSHLRDRCK